MVALAVACNSENAPGDAADAAGSGGVMSVGGTESESDGSDSQGSDSQGSDSQGSDSQGSDSQGSDSQGSDSTFPKFDLGGIPDVPTGCGATGDTGPEVGGFSYIWIANSPEGTVSKIDTETGVELGRYNTSEGSNSPSRTSVNQFGDVAVGNRGDAGSITKLAAQLEDCVDSNGTPGIQTSTGPDDVLPWSEDECVLWKTDVPSADYGRGPRAVAWEGGEIDPVTCVNTVPNPRLWVSWRGDGDTIEIRRLDGSDGAILDSTSVVGGGGRTYGGAVDGDGNFWIATRGGQDNLIFVDAESVETVVYDVPIGDNYGMTVDKDGNPWVVTYNSGTNYVWKLDATTEQFVEIGQGERYRGVQIDREGRVWIAGNSPCRLALADSDNESLITDTIDVPGCTTPVGTSIDRDGYVWVVDQGSSSAFKIDPDTRTVVLTVEGLVSPYTYSDMTGSGLDLVINPPG